MKSRQSPLNITLHHPPSPKPLLVFDGECRFCRFWVGRLKASGEGRVDFAPYQEAAIRFPEIPMAEFDKAVQYLTPEGRVHSAAEAVFRVLALDCGRRWPLWFYENIPGVRTIAESVYRFVARNRPFFSRIALALWGKRFEPSEFFIGRWLFLRGMGVIYLMAFASLGTQVEGLIGSKGILPAATLLDAVRERWGAGAFWRLPSLFWWNAGDFWLQAACYTGAALSVFLIMGLCPVLTAAALWVLYLSLLNVGQEFLSFQWDALLLEAGFLAIFLAPLQWKQNIAREAPPSRLFLWLSRWLLFRLMFSSGIVKLVSRDPTWNSLTALTFHYETQPLPTWIGWTVHQAPVWFHQLSCAVMFFVEIALPFFLFAPRRLRHFASLVLISLQLMILVTGNFCFFNWLAVLLCLAQLDDASWPERVPRFIQHKRSWSPDYMSPSLTRLIAVPVAAFLFVFSSYQTAARFQWSGFWPSWMADVHRRVSPFHIVSSYGLFAVMTIERIELSIEGSNDGEHWQAYEFKHKPNGPASKPRFVAPHQPRLDWQMWFAALGSYQDNPWFVNLCFRLLQGSPPVLALLAKNPFPDSPPRYIRAVGDDYRFTDLKTRREKGAWWTVKRKGLYLPVISLRET